MRSKRPVGMGENYADGKTEMSWRAAHKIALVVSILIGFTISVGQAHAGSCKKTSRTFTATGFSADTTVKNRTDDQILVIQILRRNGVKEEKEIDPGENASHLAKIEKGLMEADWPIDLSVKIKPKGGDEDSVATCVYRVNEVRTGSGGAHYRWELAGDSLCDGKENDLCEGCKVECDKTYHPGKNRYSTTFTIAD